jgi:hypothetical protein
MTISMFTVSKATWFFAVFDERRRIPSSVRRTEQTGGSVACADELIAKQRFTEQIKTWFIGSGMIGGPRD